MNTFIIHNLLIITPFYFVNSLLLQWKTVQLRSLNELRAANQGQRITRNREGSRAGRKAELHWLPRRAVW